MTVNYSVIVSCSTHFPPGGRNSGSTTDRVIADSRYSEARLIWCQHIVLSSVLAVAVCIGFSSPPVLTVSMFHYAYFSHSFLHCSWLHKDQLPPMLSLLCRHLCMLCQLHACSCCKEFLPCPGCHKCWDSGSCGWTPTRTWPTWTCFREVWFLFTFHY